MATWIELSHDCRTASHELFHAGRWRDCVSRSYYGVYSLVAHHLLAAGVEMPRDRANPEHPPWLSSVIGNNLQAALPDTRVRWNLANAVDALFKLRVNADYKPNVVVGMNEARVALAIAASFYEVL